MNPAVYLDFYASLKNDFAENDKKVTVYSKIARSLFKVTTPDMYGIIIN